ncbi:MAG: hypothetical protein OXI63_09055 [Candidatus Poribacteria bacterium]|nr:hypothetical protein [Candidatus Poribacteria bacterium]MDE0683047.1 hypothetical protein [Candidatus Poribacteria bacterium]
MNAPEHRKRNRRLGLILALLFVGLFAIVTAAIITGSKAPQSVESVVSSLVVPVLGIIGLLLIIAAIGEIVQKRRLTIILSLLVTVLFVIGAIAGGVTATILGVAVRIIVLLLIIAAVVEIVLRILKNRVRE